MRAAACRPRQGRDRGGGRQRGRRAPLAARGLLRALLVLRLFLAALIAPDALVVSRLRRRFLGHRALHRLQPSGAGSQSTDPILRQLVTPAVSLSGGPG
jgi:hypothetical protein